MRWIALSFILFSGCSLPDESSLWGSFSPRNSSFRTGSSSSHHPGDNLSNFAEFDEEDVWTVGGELTWYWGKKDSPASWWKDREISRSEILDREQRQDEIAERTAAALEAAIKALARERLQEPPESTQPPPGVDPNVTAPTDRPDVPEPPPTDPESRPPDPGPKAEALGLLKLYLEADWVTQVVVGTMLLFLVVVLAGVAVLRGPALIAAWRGYWEKRRARKTDQGDEIDV